MHFCVQHVHLVDEQHTRAGGMVRAGQGFRGE